MNDDRYFLLRYDTENHNADEMQGFLPKVLEVHTREQIPVTLFCTGKTIDDRRDEFVAFWDEARDNPYIEVQDHSYTHIGVGYEDGVAVDVLRADYVRSFAAHKDIFKKEVFGVALCGVSDSGPRLPGLDSTEKSKEELAMLASLGCKMLPAYVTYAQEAEFCNYAELGYPDIMGFPSRESDTSWLMDKDAEYARNHMKSAIDSRWDAGTHGAVILHDWCQWKCGPDKELSLVVEIANYAREKGFKLATMTECYNNSSLWR